MRTQHRRNAPPYNNRSSERGRLDPVITRVHGRPGGRGTLGVGGLRGASEGGGSPYMAAAACCSSRCASSSSRSMHFARQRVRDRANTP